MIIFELACAVGHRFEGWFASSEAFALQQERALVTCPECGSADVMRIPHAKIARGEAEAPPRRPGGGGSGQHSAAARSEAAAAFVRHVLENTEDVGPAFAEEARRIHYQEVPQRAIRGVASPKETRDLIDEGIGVLPLPVPPADERH